MARVVAVGLGGLFPPDVDSEEASGAAGDIYRRFFPPNNTLVLDGYGVGGSPPPLGLGLDDLHDNALDLVLQGAFDTTLGEWDRWWLAFYYIQVAYKMGGVEPLVNADNYNAKSPDEIKSDHRLRLVMEAYPAKALELAERALALARTAG